MNLIPTRRQFTQAVSAAIATSQFPILGANDRVNLGIVGLGSRGNDHMNYYGELGDSVKMVAICDAQQAARERASAKIEKAHGYKPTEYSDMRKLFESKDVDAVSMPLPNHWHALATIWACQAGKDVYIEKPASHNIYEGQKMVEAARKYKRMVQVGSQSRTIPHKVKAVQLVRDGAIGKLYQVKGICYRRRFSIGHYENEAVPAGVNWDQFLGPAPMRPFNKNRFVYNWHWMWDTGNGDVGNQGVHEMDTGLAGIARPDWPTSVVSTGGKFVWQDDQETPNTLFTSFNFGDMQYNFEVRNLPTPTEALAPLKPNYVGNIFMGEKGFIVVDHEGYQMYHSSGAMISGEAARGAAAGGQEKYIKDDSEKPSGELTTPHMKNFIDAVKSRDLKSLHAEVEIGVRSAAFCHLANIAYRANRMLKLDPKTGAAIGDEEVSAMYTRDYREPYVVPDKV